MFPVRRVEQTPPPFLQFRSIDGGASGDDKDHGLHFEHVGILLTVSFLNSNAGVTGVWYTNLDLKDSYCAKIQFKSHPHADCRWRPMSE